MVNSHSQRNPLTFTWVILRKISLFSWESVCDQSLYLLYKSSKHFFFENTQCKQSIFKRKNKNPWSDEGLNGTIVNRYVPFCIESFQKYVYKIIVAEFWGEILNYVKFEALICLVQKLINNKKCIKPKIHFLF